MMFLNRDDGKDVIEVMGVPYTVKDINPPSRDDGFMGRTDPLLCEITINNILSPEQREVTLIHEWIHAIWSNLGVTQEEQDEVKINALALELNRRLNADKFKKTSKDEGKKKEA